MFSVVIPLYNKEKYILRAVESVLNQTYKDFELIVVDDGSTDKSLEKIKKINDTRLHIIQQENQGEGPARNSGVLAVKNEWIAFLDADDAWLPWHLEEMNKIIVKCSNVGMVSTGCIEIQDSSKENNISDNSESDIININYFAEAAKNIGIINSTSVAIKKDVFVKIGEFSNFKAGADLEYWARVALYFPVAVSKRITCYYFRDTDGVMKNIAKNNIKDPKSLESISLYDISPSVRFLMSESEKNPNILKDSNIILYINSRLINAVKGGIFNKDFSKANSFAKLALPQLNRTYAYMLVYSLTPNLLLNKAYSCYLHIKR